MYNCFFKLIFLILVSQATFGEVVDIDYLIGTSGQDLSDKEIHLQDDSYKVIKKLGSGNTTNVYHIEAERESYALRVPKYKGLFNTFSNYEDFIDAYLLGHDVLNRQKVSIPKIFKYEQSSFLIVEKIDLNNSFDLKSFFFNQEEIDSQKLNEAKIALKIFIEQVAAFSEIKDFHLKQALYLPIEKKWILVDWSMSHKVFSSIEDPVVLSSKAINSKWEEHVLENNLDSENHIIPDYKPDEEMKEFLVELDEITKNIRSEILAKEELYIKDISVEFRNINTVEDFKKLVNKTPAQYSSRYVEFIIDVISKEERFELGDILNSIPHYIVSDNKDLESVINIFSEKISNIKDLSTLLKIRKTMGLQISWFLSMKIQKIVTSSIKEDSSEIYKELLENDLVSNYAKAWIKREALVKLNGEDCLEAFSEFMKISN